MKLGFKPLRKEDLLGLEYLCLERLNAEIQLSMRQASCNCLFLVTEAIFRLWVSHSIYSLISLYHYYTALRFKAHVPDSLLLK